MERKDVLVENRLLKIEDNFITADGRGCVVDVVVQDVGAWHVKFRETCVIVNRRDLILSNCVQVDATLTFSTFEAFSELSSQQSTLQQQQQRGVLRVEQRDPSFTAGLNKLFKTLQARDESALSPKKARPSSSSMNLEKKPIKMGWCFKKRDIIMGWRCRYFKIFQGQVEYFRDEGDLIPRGVIPILGAEIKGPLKCTVNGAHECFSISIEPRHKDKVFRLASIKSGNDGMEDVLSWISALVAAAKPVEAPSTADASSPFNGDVGDLPGSDMGSPRIRPRSMSTGGGSAGYSNPPPLMPGSSNSSRGSTRIKRSILGTVVAAVQRRGSGSGAAPSWVSATTSAAHQGAALTSPSASSGNARSRGYSGGSAASEISAADRGEGPFEDPAFRTDGATSLHSGERLVRIEILIGSIVVIIAGGLKAGLYGVIAAAFLCILTILIAFVPLTL